MKTSVLFLTFACLSIACGTSSKDGAPEGLVSGADQQLAPVMVPTPQERTIKVAVPDGMTLTPGNIDEYSGIRGIILRNPDDTKVIAISYLLDNNSDGAGALLLKHAKQFRTQLAPELPFPRVTTYDHGDVATVSQAYSPRAGTFSCFGRAYVKVDQSIGRLISVLIRTPGNQCSSIETEAYTLAKTVRVE